MDSSSKFPPGRVVVTGNAAESLFVEYMAVAFGRYLRGDGGELAAPNRQDNERGFLQGCRLLSAYQTRTGLRFWIITDPDRSITTVLLREDY